MLTVLIDYESGNLHSAEKAFQKMAAEQGSGQVVVTSDPDLVARADRIVLPGDGAFPSCAAALRASGNARRKDSGQVDAIAAQVICENWLESRQGH